MKKILPLAFIISAVSSSLIIGCVRKSEEDTTTTPNQPPIQADTDTKIPLSSDVQNAYMSDTRQGILARYTLAQTQAFALQSDINTACQSDTVSSKQLHHLRQQWLRLAQLWSKAEIVNFGPVNENMRHLYINYYPDSRNVGKKELDALLSTQTNFDKAGLKNESAIIQGLSGLEILLFSNDTLDSSKCRYAAANIDLLNEHVAQIVAAWQASDEIAPTLTLDAWANSMLAMLELTKTNAIEKPFGILGKPTGHVPARYANSSQALLVAKLESLSFAIDDDAFKALVDEKSPNNPIASDLIQAIQATQEHLDRMPKDLSLANDEDKTALAGHFGHLIWLFKRQLMPSLGVQVGFNTSDGD